MVVGLGLWMMARTIRRELLALAVARDLSPFVNKRLSVGAVRGRAVAAPAGVVFWAKAQKGV